ncbi:MAG: 2-C-methyl-D-erythritol 4-phosphate cytidylyltransferase [Proteobacteria bacterium]|nr:2-C-methyl-D-erythritol 4-phosphate cytidylyltransferase [Pseudomonadota bacterium]
MNIAVILSAGAGLRFNDTSPKQFLLLDGKPILYHSIKKFQEYPGVDKILIVSHPDYMNKTKEICSEFSKIAGIIQGGERRQDSVWNALDWININQKKCELVFIHDSARPLLSDKLLEALYKAANRTGAAIPCISADDTIKEISGYTIKKTLKRDELVRVQTPQVFDFRKIYKAYLSFPKDQIATDDAFVAEVSGIKVYVVEGDKNNIKITHPVDLKIAELFIKEVS